MDRYTINTNEASDLPNLLGLTNPKEINEAEFIGFIHAQNTAIDALGEATIFSLEYLYTLHREALEAVYDFAGRLRTVNMSKNGFAFPAAAFLPSTMQTFEKMFLTPINQAAELDQKSFLLKLAALHAELLYIHPFREGNGRTVRLFTGLISLAKTGKDISFDVLNEKDNFVRYVAAVQQAAAGEYTLMQELFIKMQA